MENNSTYFDTGIDKFGYVTQPFDYDADFILCSKNNKDDGK